MTASDSESLDHLEREAARFLSGGADQQAAQLCFQGLRRFGDTVGLLGLLVKITLKHGDFSRAADYLQRLLALTPDDLESLSLYANVLTAQERNDEAVDAHIHVLDKDPSRHSSLVNLGMLLVKKQRPQEALTYLQKAAEQAPDDGLVQTWLGYAYSALGRLEEAVTCYRRIYDDPEYGPAIHLPLAIAYRDTKALADANIVLEAILQRQPGNAVARFFLGQNQLSAGDFKNGFANYESRWERPDSGRPEMPGKLWQGEEVAGKTILVHDEQGFGDCIQFSRFLKPLQDKGAHVLFQVRPKLRRLMQGLEGVDAFVDPGEAEAEFHSPLMSLPLRLGYSADDIQDQPYLKVPADEVAAWAERLPPKRNLRIGLVWQGDPKSQAETGRSVPFSILRQLFDLTDCDFVLLQKFHGREDIIAAELPDNVIDLGDAVDNGPDAFVDTAAVIANLDLLVSSDTAAAHLAGAIGIPAIVLLKFMPEWRWMLDRSDSIWYRDMMLLRQPERGDWQSVVDELTSLLEEKAGDLD